ncbi:MAG: ABC transporter ATP-binding protein [Acidimicrobiia bacterium]
MSAIVVRGLAKHYGSVQAVRGISLTIEEGEVFALLGPNGAGKTTTIEILEGHRQRTAGEVSVLGHDPETGGREFRERIGIVLQTAGIDKELTPRELLALYAPMFPRSRPIDRVIERVGLTDKADDRIGALSGGQRRRVDLALGLIGDPDLIFLDEPTTGFDPSARRKAWELVDNLRALGKTILLTTHYMDEAQNLADRVAVIAAGGIVAEGTPETLGGREDASTRVSFRLPTGVSVSELPERVLSTARVSGSQVELGTGEPTAVLHALTAWAVGRGIELEGLNVTRPSLEDIYLELTGADRVEDA